MSALLLGSIATSVWEPRRRRAATAGPPCALPAVEMTAAVMALQALGVSRSGRKAVSRAPHKPRAQRRHRAVTVAGKKRPATDGPEVAEGKEDGGKEAAAAKDKAGEKENVAPQASVPPKRKRGRPTTLEREQRAAAARQAAANADAGGPAAHIGSHSWKGWHALSSARHHAPRCVCVCMCVRMGSAG